MSLVYGSVCSGIELGDRFGRLVAVERIPGRRADHWRWRCSCDFRANRIKSDATAEELRAVLTYVEALSC